MASGEKYTMKRLVLPIFMAGWYFVCLPFASVAQFEILDFELATVPAVQFGGFVPFSEGMPFWGGGYEGSVQAEILHNNAILWNSYIAIIGPGGGASSTCSTASSSPRRGRICFSGWRREI